MRRGTTQFDRANYQLGRMLDQKKRPSRRVPEDDVFALWLSIPAPPRSLDRGDCRDYPQAMFFPERNEDCLPAKLICRTCPVRQNCLDYALSLPAFHDHGIMGGYTKAERLDLRNERKKNARKP